MYYTKITACIHTHTNTHTHTVQHQEDVATSTPGQEVPAADQVTTSASNAPDIISSLVDKGQSSPATLSTEDIGGNKEMEKGVVPKESAVSGTEAKTTPSLEPDKTASQEGTDISSSASDIKLSTAVRGSPMPVEKTSQRSSTPSGDESQSKERPGTDNEGGKEPAPPQTPTASGQIGGMFTRLRKAWQGGEAKVS